MPRKVDPARLDWFEARVFAEMRSPQTTCRLAREQFGIGRRQASRYIAKVRKRWADARSANLEDIRADLDSKLRTIAERAFESGDNRSAVSAVRELKSLHGADGATRVAIEHSGALGLITDADPTVVAEKLTELRKKQGG